MNKYIFIFLLLVSGNVWAITCNVPSSTYTYISGTPIQPNQLQTNENNLYTYDQQGVCNYLSGSITQAAVSSTAGILYSQLNLSGGILPGDFNTTTTTSIYQLENLNIPNGGTLIFGNQHIGDILVDNGSTFVRLPEGNAGKVLTSQGNATAPIYSFPSGQLGAWSASGSGSCGGFGSSGCLTNTVYGPMPTDGFVFSIGVTSNGVQVQTDSSSTPSTARFISGSISGNVNSAMSVVRKNDYWEAFGSGASVYWIPLGS